MALAIFIILMFVFFRAAVATMSAGSLTPNPKDDPMDLGPFMQEYVLRNPFNPAMLSPPVAKNSAATSPVKVTIPKSDQKVSPHSVSRSPSHSPAPVTVKKENSPSPAPSVGKSDNVATSSNGSQPTSPAHSEGEEGVDFVVKEDMSGRVVDTPKAHIGSNASYATQLREMKLPPKHNKVKKW